MIGKILKNDICEGTYLVSAFNFRKSELFHWSLTKNTMYFEIYLSSIFRRRSENNEIQNKKQIKKIIWRLSFLQLI